MFIKTTVVILSIVTTAGAASTVDVQFGLTQFYRDDRYDDVNERGYKGDIGYELAFGNWALDLNVRALGFPGSQNTFAWYADLSTPFYFSEAPVRIYIAPGFGYSHSETRRYFGGGYFGGEPGRSKHDFIRVVCGFGVKVSSGSKRLIIGYALVPEFPTGETTTGYYSPDFVDDFYLEQTIEAEFGWAFSKHFGLTSKVGVIYGNHATTRNNESETGYVPFAEVGPSIYF